MKLENNRSLGFVALLAAHLLALGPLCAQEQPQSLPAALREIRIEAREQVASGELPSLAIGVVRKGEVIWKETMGWADREGRRPAKSTTPYGLASLGKSITATALMKLVESGSIGLDDLVSEHLGKETLWSPAGHAETVRVRHLLDMTASIPHGNYTYLRAEDAAALTPEKLARDRGLIAFPPGRFFTYSNFSYGVLEHLIERVAGTSYEDHLRGALFEPLGMTNSLVSATTRPDGAVVKYGSDGTRLDPVYPHPRSSRSLHASLDDLLRYARFNLGEDLPDTVEPLSPASLRRLQFEKPSLERALLALGWGSIDLDGDRWLLTNGRSSGVQSTLTIWPAEDIAVVVLTNISGNVTDDLALRILDALVPGFLDRTARAREEWETWAERDWETDEALLGSWRGRLSGRSWGTDLELVFQPDGDIHVLLGDQPPTLLSRLGLNEGLLNGRFVGELQLEETAGHPHRIDLSLRIESREAEGYALAVFENERGRFALPSYVRLVHEAD